MRLSEDLWEMMEEAKSILREESILRRGAVDTKLWAGEWCA